jgi:glycine/sarcosine N-methyltransferase
MVPMTDKVNSVDDFYDTFSDDYDIMTDYQGRFNRDRPIFKALVDRYHLTSALDAGCGSSFHAILLAQLGLQVTAVDMSEKMVQKTVQHAIEFNVKILAMQSSFIGIENKVQHSFDSLFCLGNTLPHMMSFNELRQMFTSFYKILKPEGLLFLQFLNYSAILKEQKRVQSIKEVGNSLYIRFYDYEAQRIMFNILTIRRTPEGVQHALQSIPLTPWTADEVVSTLTAVGFSNIELFGNLSFHLFNPVNSKDVIIKAQK